MNVNLIITYGYTLPNTYVSKLPNNNIGYNAKTDKIENLIEAGVIDATLVLKNALQNVFELLPALDGFRK